MQLAEALERRPLRKKVKTITTNFQKASRIPKLTLDIPKLDSALNFLTLNQRVCIAGVHTQKLIERICVHAQLPRRHGGMDTRVLLVDGSNSSDVYRCVNFARQYGLNVGKVLDGIISSRAFTVYQLTNIIIYDLAEAIKRYDAKLVVITNLLHFFTSEPYLDSKEMERILRQIVKALEQVQDCLVVVSLGSPTRYDNIVYRLFSKTIRIDSDYNSLSILINDGGKRTSLSMRVPELETVHTN